MQAEKIRRYVRYPDTTAAQAAIEEQTTTKKRVGLWIDHRKAVIVTLTDTDEGHKIKQVISHLESDARPAAGWPAHSVPDYRADSEDHQDRRFMSHLERYYDEVITAIHDAHSILIFGPGEAKGELKKRIESKRIGIRKVAVETTDEMTTPQIAAKVRQHFLT